MAAMPRHRSPGFVLERGTNLAGDYVVRGLSITGFTAQQQQQQSSNFGCSVTYHSYGIVVQAVTSAFITGNFIGLLPDGETARGNYAGVTCTDGAIASIGGGDPASRNIISGNTGAGVQGFSDESGDIITGAPLVQGNYIGTDASGTKAVPNADGILLAGNYSSPTTIGGTSSSAANLISGNDYGIYLGTERVCMNIFTFYAAANVPIQGNLIGLQADGVKPLPNRSAIELLVGSNNVIGGLEAGAGNVIAFNGSAITVSNYPQRPGPGPEDRVQNH